MLIRRIKLKNFRQFYGEHEIVFPTTGARNVTLIHAENGFGKTSILNAVLWCLFRDTTPKFEKPEDITNYDALKEGTNTASVDVEVEVEAEGKTSRYLIRRTFDAAGRGRDKTELSAFKIVKGSYQTLNAPETFVGSVIPREMAKYFFFDGEAAENFAAAKNYRQIGESIRSILGCALADTAIADLKELCKAVDRQIGETGGDRELEQLEKSIEKVQSELEVAANLREQKLEEIATYKALHQEIEQKLRDAAGAQEIQKERDRKTDRKRQVSTELAACEAEVLKWIGLRAMVVVSRRLTKVALDFVDEASLRGRIPSPYNEDFVKGLLDAEQCVCHRPLKMGTPEWKAVAELLKTASNAELMGRVVRARARSQMLQASATDAPGVLAGLLGTKARLLAERTGLEQEIAELGKKIEGLPLAEIAERERARKKAEKDLERVQQEVGAVKAHIGQLELQKAGMVREYEELGRKNKRTVRLFAKRALLLKSMDLLEGLLKSYESQARKDIESQVNEILEVVAHKDYRCRLNDNFSIELILNDRATPKSAGENQLLSLAFIASLVQFAANRVDADDLILKPGIVAPLVLDAPLGQLDPSYQESVAMFLPRLAHQVVLLVSSAQGGDRVLKALEPYVGAEYLLVQENVGPRKQKQLLRHVIHGREWDLVLFERKHTMTNIVNLG